MRLLLPAGALLLSLLLLACTAEDPASAPTTRPAAEAPANVVEWPQLRALDALAHRAEAAARIGDADAIREIAPELARLTEEVTPETLPPNAKNQEEVRLLVEDLRALGNEVARAAQVEDAPLLSAATGLHGLILEIMAKAGMPHVHDDHEHDHDHDHAEHDHDHDHSDHDHEH